QDAKVAQGALDHIEDVIIALSDRGFHEEHGLDQVVKGIFNHAFETLLIIELDPQPQLSNRRIFCEELDLLVIPAPIKTLDEEHGFERIEGHGNALARLDRTQLKLGANLGGGVAKEFLQIIFGRAVQIALEKFPIAMPCN